jgi:hypothetical protein
MKPPQYSVGDLLWSTFGVEGCRLAMVIMVSYHPVERHPHSFIYDIEWLNIFSPNGEKMVGSYREVDIESWRFNYLQERARMGL